MDVNSRHIATDIAECAFFIVLMVAATYIQIPFPLVPLTFQTVVSVLAGLMLGAKKGIISMAVYCFMGLVGLPVFTAGGGIVYVLKPSFGYILGAIFFHRFHNLFFPVNIGRIHNDEHGFLGSGNILQRQNCRSNQQRSKKRDDKQPCPADNPHTDGPEKKNQIHRFFYRCTESYNGQCAHHP